MVQRYGERGHAPATGSQIDTKRKAIRATGSFYRGHAKLINGKRLTVLSEKRVRNIYEILGK